MIERCTLLGVAPPPPTPELNHIFERSVTFAHGNGSTGRVDCYRRGHLMLKAKKLMVGAHAKSHGVALPAGECRPPFVLVVNVGTVIEVYAEFSRSGGT